VRLSGRIHMDEAPRFRSARNASLERDIAAYHPSPCQSLRTARAVMVNEERTGATGRYWTTEYRCPKRRDDEEVTDMVSVLCDFVWRALEFAYDAAAFACGLALLAGAVLICVYVKREYLTPIVRWSRRRPDVLRKGI